MIISDDFYYFLGQSGVWILGVVFGVFMPGHLGTVVGMRGFLLWNSSSMATKKAWVRWRWKSNQAKHKWGTAKNQRRAWLGCRLGQLMFSRVVVQSPRLPGFPAFRCLSEFVQTHVHWVGDSIQPSHPMSPLSPPALNLPSIRIFSRVYLSKNYVSSFRVILAVFQI